MSWTQKISGRFGSSPPLLGRWLEKLIVRTLDLFSVIAFLVPIERAMAAPQPLPVPAINKSGFITHFIESGALIGGVAGDELSLVSVSMEHVKSTGGERFAFIFGDRLGNALRGEPGYYHVELSRDSRRVVIDLAQIRKTAVDPERLVRALTTSRVVSSSEITMDPADGSTNITLNLKSSVRMRVGSENGSEAGSDSGRVSSRGALLMIDLQPFSVSRKADEPLSKIHREAKLK